MQSKLITIPMSHYCERARWALEYCGVSYTEQAHLQFFHYLAVLRAGGGVTAPSLVTDERVLDDSADIVRFADRRAINGQHLYPEGRRERQLILDLERQHAEELGRATRLILYAHVRDQPQLISYAYPGTPKWQQALAPRLFGPLMRYIFRRLHITAATQAVAHETTLREFNEVQDRMKDDRSYLMGDRFGAADLTFACMAAPLILPDQYGVPLPRLEELPDELRKTVETLREHPAGRFALRLFADHRGRAATTPAA